MASNLWKYLANPFDNTTKRNFKQMNLLATDHHDKLKSNISNPQINTLYNYFLPIYTDYKQLFIQSSANSGRYRSNTQSVESLLDELSGQKIKFWDIKIQNEYIEGTPEYKSLLPDGRKPFQKGAYENRIREVWALADRLSDYPVLATIEADVRQFAANLEASRTTQQGAEHDSSNISRQLESARQNLAKAMHYIFASLITIHIDNVSFVETYYDLEYLRTPESAKRKKGTTTTNPDDTTTSITTTTV